jgi:hypothetical protein
MHYPNTTNMDLGKGGGYPVATLAQKKNRLKGSHSRTHVCVFSEILKTIVNIILFYQKNIILY